jgi:hypothetical protein
LGEALSHLLAEGLVLLEQQRGYAVAPVSLDDLHDVTATRRYIDSLALRRSIERGDLEWEARIVASFHRLSKIKSGLQGEPTRSTISGRKSTGSSVWRWFPPADRPR